MKTILDFISENPLISFVIIVIMAGWTYDIIMELIKRKSK